MEYRKLRENEITAFVENRIEFVKMIGELKEVGLFKVKTTEYIKKNINKDNLLIYIAVKDNEIISSCMLCIFETIPLPSNYSGKTGELLNVYTKKEYRRQGHAAKLIKLLIDEARKKGVGKVNLSYTAGGYHLYKLLGFKKIDNQMEYRL